MTQLAHKALLVHLHISQWTARKLDRKISNEVAQAHGATGKVGNFNKELIARKQLNAIQLAASQARTFHYAYTLPWSDTGERILPAELHLDYAKQIRDFRSQFREHVETFVAAYPDLVEDARKRLNGMFNEDDYPPLHQVRTKFGIQLDYSPVPQASDFRVGLQGEEVQRIRQSIERRSADLERGANFDICRRLHEVVAKMAETLARPRAVFRDSLVENVSELCAFLPKLNITEDPALAETIRTVESRLAGLNPRILRRIPRHRKQAAEQARSMADQVSALMGVYTGGDTHLEEVA